MTCSNTGHIIKQLDASEKEGSSLGDGTCHSACGGQQISHLALKGLTNEVTEPIDNINLPCELDIDI
jgi:hypothetical protein